MSVMGELRGFSGNATGTASQIRQVLDRLRVWVGEQNGQIKLTYSVKLVKVKEVGRG